MASSCNATMSLKLLIDTEKKKVLFAETGKDFVDFLFHILTLPAGSITRLLAGKRMDGCLENLYDSVKCLSDSYIQPNQDKEILLNPKLPAKSTAAANSCFLLADFEVANVEVSFRKTLYMCKNFHPFVADDTRAICPSCRKYLNTQIPYIEPEPAVAKHASTGDGKDGFVKGVVTYMIMDDLVVSPMSTISAITLLNKFNVTNVGALKEQMVTFGMDEAVKLLKASLESKAVLTDVFLSTEEK